MRRWIVAVAAVALAAGIASATPGGLSPEQTPQFVLLTHDDAIKGDSYDLMKGVTDGRSANGCPLTATMFAVASGTDCELAAALYSSGYEIADHTKSHESLNDLGRSGIEDQIIEGRRGIAECGIPEGDIQGFRAPYLDTNPTVREVLHQNGFLYDSTLIEDDHGGMGDRIWPWDMGSGIETDCSGSSESQPCSSDESYPGLYQVPVWDLTTDGHYTMDPGEDGNRDVFEILKQNFDESYAGNRAPFPVFIHTPWLRSHQDSLQQFVDYAASQPHVYFVTMRQLIAWMQNPVPADQLTPDQLGCGQAGGAPGSGGGGGGGGDEETPMPEETPELPTDEETADPEDLPADKDNNVPDDEGNETPDDGGDDSDNNGGDGGNGDEGDEGEDQGEEENGPQPGENWVLPEPQ